MAGQNAVKAWVCDGTAPPASLQCSRGVRRAPGASRRPTQGPRRPCTQRPCRGILDRPSQPFSARAPIRASVSFIGPSCSAVLAPALPTHTSDTSCTSTRLPHPPTCLCASTRAPLPPASAPRRTACPWSAGGPCSGTCAAPGPAAQWGEHAVNGEKGSWGSVALFGAGQGGSDCV